MSLLTVMIKVLLFCVLNIVCLHASNSLRGGIVEAPTASDSFLGAVVEYLPQVKDSAKDTVYANVAEYGSIIKKIKQKYSSLRIVVFPEVGLISLDWDRRNVSEMYGEAVPDPSKRSIPCNDNTAEKAIRDLSCLAKTNNIYLVVNIPEKSSRNNSDIYYNTNVVYNPSGVLVARYRKFHIYGKEGEPFSRPEKPEVVTFDVDGVTFGTFTCFDIAFKSPALDFDKKVTHIAFPTAWFSELPYLSAVQAHSAWSYARNKVLLAADYNAPNAGASGSGIYLGDSSKGVAVQTQINGTFAIVSTIPRSIEKSGFKPTYEIMKFYDEKNITQVPLKIYQDKLNVYTTEALEEPSSFQPVSENNNLTLSGTVGFNKKICNRDFCCEFVGNVTSYYVLDLVIPKLAKKGDAFGSYNYQFAVFNGVRSYGDDYATGGVQVCSIVSCLENNIGLCGNRTDSAPPLTISQYSNYQYKKVQTTFDILTIKSNLTTYSNTSASSNIMLATPPELQNATKNGFGEIADPESYSLTKEAIINNETALHVFQIQTPISNPASLNIYNRIFTRDGEKPTSGSNAMFNISSILFIIALLNAFILNR